MDSKGLLSSCLHMLNHLPQMPAGLLYQVLSAAVMTHQGGLPGGACKQQYSKGHDSTHQHDQALGLVANFGITVCRHAAGSSA